MRQITKKIRGIFSAKRKSAFSELSDCYRERIENLWAVEQMPPIRRPGKIAILLTPWGRTAVPFYSMELALALRRRGCDSTLILDDENIFKNANDSEEKKSIRNLAKKLAHIFPLITLSEKETPLLQEKSVATLHDIVFENAVRQEKSESRGEHLLRENPIVFETFHRHCRRARALLKQLKISALVIPGGIWGISGTYAVAANDLDLTYWTYDSGPGQLTLARNGVSAHFPDYAEAYSAALSSLENDPKLSRHVMEQALARIAIRRAGRDDFRLQPEKSEKPAQAFDLVVLLNYRADTAAMGRNLAFPNVSSWLRALVDWVQSQDNITMAIRQHPCERISAFRSLENYEWLRNAASGKVQFYASEDPINTYDLIDTAKVVLPYTTRTGLEAALLGKEVVLATQCYYACCPFIKASRTQREYFENIASALAHPARHTLDLKQALAYFLAEYCLFANTIFTPIQADFRKWNLMAPEAMHDVPAHDQILSCIEKNTNFLLTRFQTILTAQG